MAVVAYVTGVYLDAVEEIIYFIL